ncbi:MAG: hypothetical protein GY925_07995 [Actinomycetia bacterium]|nr:hypothetical protein [Actinomycetes bacterium]
MEILAAGLSDFTDDVSAEEFTTEAGSVDIGRVVVVQLDLASGFVRRVTATERVDASDGGRTDTTESSPTSQTSGGQPASGTRRLTSTASQAAPTGMPP